MATRAETRRPLGPESPSARIVPGAGAGADGAHRRHGFSPVLILLLLLIIAFGVVRSVGPLGEYREAQRERDALEAQVALLEQENASVESEIGRLEQDTYVEALARSELSVARPGEEVFIVTGLPTTTTDTAPEEVPAEPGPLEKMLSSLRRLF